MNCFRTLLICILLGVGLSTYGQTDVFKYRVDSTLISNKNDANKIAIWRPDKRLNAKFVVYYPKRSKLYVYGNYDQSYSIVEDHLTNDEDNGWFLESMTAIDKLGDKCDLKIIMYSKGNKNYGLIELIIDYGFKIKYEMGKDD